MTKTIYLLLFFATFITLNSCIEDDSIKSHKEEYVKKKITFREFLDAEGGKQKIKSIQKYFQGIQSNVSDKNPDSINWEIDTTRVNQVITPDVTTYTFWVNEQDTIEGFRNVLVKVNGDNVETSLIHYPDGIDFENHTTRSAIGEEIEPEVWGKATTCYEVIIFTVSCDDTECEYGWGLVEVPCGGGGGGATGGNNGSGNGGIATDPIGFPPTDDGGGSSGGNGGGGNINTYFLNLLTSQQLQWLNQNYATRTQIYNYLQLNNYSDQSIDFAMWAVEYLMDNPSYNFNNLMWIQDLDFSYVEKNYIFSNYSLVNFINALMIQHDIDIDSRERIAGLYVAFESAYANNTLNSLAQNPLYDYFWDKIEEYISSAAYNGTAKAFRIMHRLYWGISQTTDPNKINNWNIFVIDPMRSAVVNSNYVNMSPNAMSWKDVLLIWLFELGNYPNIHDGHPTIAFGTSANLVNGTSQIDGIKNHNNNTNSVSFVRQQAKSMILSGQHSGSVSRFWHFNTQILSSFISNPNYMEFLLGSYNTQLLWSPIGSNTYNFTFSIKNVTGWNSATRGVNGTYIVPNKPRGQGIHLGGTIAETFTWSETVVP